MSVDEGPVTPYVPPKASLEQQARPGALTRFEIALAAVVFVVSAVPLLLLLVAIIREGALSMPQFLVWAMSPLIGIAIGATLLLRTELGAWMGAGYFALKSVKWFWHPVLAGGTVQPWNLHFFRPNGAVVVVNLVWIVMATLFLYACIARWRRSRTPATYGEGVAATDLTSSAQPPASDT